MTDHAREKWVAIGEIACTRAISPTDDSLIKLEFPAVLQTWMKHLSISPTFCETCLWMKIQFAGCTRRPSVVPQCW